jgi:nitroimidazol reductase NimA-like FMN-containing flavoprotein (pyridoxamine 5'-phosphate oxidase superfamily)
MTADQAEPAAIARAVLDANRYLTLATADGAGTPWASPVWFAHDAYVELLWASRPEARHSRNIAGRPEVGIVVFDSSAPPGDPNAVYAEAIAAEVPEEELDRALETYSARSLAQGLPAWTVSDVTAPAAHRLYRATATRHFLLDEHDRRVAVDLGAR